MKRFRPTFQRLLFVVTAAAVLGTLTFLIGSTLLSPYLESREIRSRAVELAKAQHAELERIMAAAEAELASFASAETLRPVPADDCRHYFGDLSRQHPHLGVGGIMTLAGTIRCGPPDNGVADAAALALTATTAIRERRFRLGGYAASKANEPTRVLQMAAPVKREGGPPSEAIVAEMRLDWLAERFSQGRLGNDATLTIADRDAITLVGPRIIFPVAGHVISPRQRSLIERSGPGVVDAQDQIGRRYFIAYFPLRSNGVDLYLSVDLYRDELLSGLDRMFDNVYIAIYGSALCVAALMAWLIGRRVFGSTDR